MKKSVSTLMVFAIFTLSFACTMSFCPMMVNTAKAEVSDKDAVPPCHGGSASTEEEKSHTPMLASDCLGVDLVYFDQNIDLTANLTLEHIELAWVDASANYDFLLNSGHFIRGPPFDASPPHAVSTDIYLTTQRLRI